MAPRNSALGTERQSRFFAQLGTLGPTAKLASACPTLTPASLARHNLQASRADALQGLPRGVASTREGEGGPHAVALVHRERERQWRAHVLEGDTLVEVP